MLIISIHAPLAGSDSPDVQSHGRVNAFQSTLPLRGATAARFTPAWVALFQSTLPLRGATCGRVVGDLAVLISIHAPLAGSDHAVLVTIFNI